MKKIKLILMLLFALYMSIAMIGAVANAGTPADSLVDDKDVNISVACGTLKGSGAVLITDKATNTVYKLAFICPSFTI